MSYDYYVRLSQRPGRDVQDIDAATAEYHRLVATGREETANDLRQDWADARLIHTDVDTSNLNLWPQMAVPSIELSLFVPYTVFLQFPFRLTKSYLSKDEQDFYIIDNPVRRDKVFQLPYVAPSSWKGSLRAALWKQGYDESHASIQRLFGNEKGEEDSFRAGRLRFFPTFFNQHSLEIINPHDRERRVGVNPILFESVPSGTPGVFSLLCVPFDRIGQNEAQTRQETARDLELVADGVHAMFCVYGFGAKTNSGFGAAVENFVGARDRRRDNLPDGQVLLKAALDEPQKVQAFRKEYGRFDDFTPEEWRTLLDDNEFKTYQAARTALERHRDEVATGWVRRGAESFEGLVKAMTDLSKRLHSEKGGTG